MPGDIIFGRTNGSIRVPGPIILIRANGAVSFVSDPEVL